MRIQLDWGGSSATVAYISKLKPKPESILWNPRK